MENRNIAVLTEEDVKYARDYIPMAEKQEFVSYAAERCFDRMEIATESGEAVPPMYKENGFRKAQYMMAALITLYLGIRSAEGEDRWTLTDAEYEVMAESHILSQLERIKKMTKDAALRDKIYDLVADYRMTEKLLNAEIFGLLNAMNDTVARLQSLLSTVATPDSVLALSQAADSAVKDIEDYMKTRGKDK